MIDSKTPEPNQKPNGGSITKKKLTSVSIWAVFKGGFVAMMSIGILTLVGLFLYGLSIEESIRVKFDGKRWNIPAQAYARSLTIHKDKYISQKDFLYELNLLGYRSVKNIDKSGTYRVINKNKIELNTRAFNFWDGVEPSKHVIIEFDKNTVVSLKNIDKSDEPIIRLDPLLMGSFYTGKGEDRTIIKLSELPKIIPQTLIAVEDKDYYQHFGVSPVGTARAMIANIRAGRMIQGGSTITQQLAKNFYLNNRRTLSRKIKEAVTAIILEINYSKDDLLEVYLNEVFFAQNGQRKIHGIAMASQFFFDRPPQELTIAQVASLIGVLKATTTYNPRLNPKQAAKRRNLIIDILVADGVIDKEIAAIEKARPLEVIETSSFSRTNTKFPGFMGMVKKQLLSDYSKSELQNNGIKVFTTFNPISQRNANESVQTIMPKLNKLAKLPPNSLQTAMVVANTKTGEIEALVAGRDFKTAGFNRAINAKRQIGSLIKPIIYLSALEYHQHFTLATLLNDTSFELEIKNGKWQERDYEKEYKRLLEMQSAQNIESIYNKEFFDNLWRPQNYDGKEYHSVMLIDSLAHSHNLSTARLGLDIGINNIINKLYAFGFKGKIRAFPSVLLGAISMSPIEVAQYYITLANKGFYIPLRTIKAAVNQNGKLLKNYNITLNKVANDDVTFLTYMGMRKAVETGTAKKINRHFKTQLNIAGKTGTTNDYRDSWFAGFSGNYLTVSWVGNDDNKTTNLTGSKGALTLWIDTMKRLKQTSYKFKAPSNIEFAYVHKQTGEIVDESCELGLTLPFISGSVPEKTGVCVEITTKNDSGNLQFIKSQLPSTLKPQ